jgi:hypothetical protein
MPIPFPNTAGFLLSFHSLTVSDSSGPDIGIREIQLKNTKQGRQKSWGGAQRPLGVYKGRDDWTAVIKWELSYYGPWKARNQPYTDKFFTWTFDYTENGLSYEIKLIGAFYVDEEEGTSVGADGSVEGTINFGVVDVEQRVDGQLIQYRLPDFGEQTA